MMMSVFLLCMLIPDVGMRQLRYSEERQARAAQAHTTSGHADEASHGAAGQHASPAPAH
jgi:hypothetical protein